jgi:hypothetical protein
LRLTFTHRVFGKHASVHKNVLKKENWPRTKQGGLASAGAEQKKDSCSKTALDRDAAALIVSLRRKQEAS